MADKHATSRGGQKPDVIPEEKPAPAPKKLTWAEYQRRIKNGNLTMEEAIQLREQYMASLEYN